MHLGDWPSFDEAYRELADEVAVRGFRAFPRGKACVEVRPASFKIERPQAALYTGASRRLNYRFWAVEALSYLAGWGLNEAHPRLMLRANRNMGFATNPQTGLFTGAYGTRLAKSYEAVEALLLKDPWSRQAVASIWEPGLPPPDPDVPCTVALHFFAEPRRGRDRDGGETRLGMAVYMRSNDLNWGTPYDVAAFAAVQLAMADGLGWLPGSYSHFAGSLHYYLDGNSQSEKPPSVALYGEERWPGPDDILCLGVPRRNSAELGRRDPIEKTALEAHVFLSELDRHLAEPGGRFESFVSSLEKQTYWRRWAGLVRRRREPRGSAAEDPNEEDHANGG